MEKIKINNIQLRGPNKSICVVEYQKACIGENAAIREATLNSKWQKEQIDYLQNSVGIGGEVSVVVVQKDQYTNITEVDMTSGGEVEKLNSNHVPGIIENAVHKATGYDRECSIVAQVILKGAVELCNTQSCTGSIGEQLALYVNELTGAYRLALSNVKAL